MERKSDKVRRLVAEGDYKAALRLAKDFRIGLTKAEGDAMKFAYECMVYPDFYRQVGRNIEQTIEQGVEVLKAHFAPVEMTENSAS